MDVLEQVKSRLDSLNTPYAFGAIREDNNGFAVKIGSESISRSVVDLIGSNSNRTDYLEIGNWRISPAEGVYGETNWHVKTSQNGSSSRDSLIELEIDDEGIRKQIETLKEQHPDWEVNLRIGAYAFFHGTLGHAYEDSRITLNSCWYEGPHDNLASFVTCLLNEDHDGIFYLFSQIKVRNEQGRTKNIEYGLNMNQYREKLEHDIKGICESGYLVNSKYETNELWIRLDLEVNESLIERAFHIAKQIYEKVNLDSSPFSSLHIVLITESNDPLTRGRMNFERVYDSNGENGMKDSLNGILLGERIAQYREALIEYIKNDNFYSEMDRNFFEKDDFGSEEYKPGESAWVFVMNNKQM